MKTRLSIPHAYIRCKREGFPSKRYGLCCTSSRRDPGSLYDKNPGLLGQGLRDLLAIFECVDEQHQASMMDEVSHHCQNEGAKPQA